MSLGTWRNPFGPGALNNLIFYEVPEATKATFACGSSGSRCSFIEADFERYDEDGGAVAVQIGGMVWTTTDGFETDVIHFHNCQYGVCFVACFNDCTCELADGTACATNTAPPTPPPTMPPTNTQGNVECALKENVDQCATVAVASNLRAGEECEYCYNFCDGDFWGCCGADGRCGGLQCEGVKVFGCPEIFDDAPTAPTPPDRGGTTPPSGVGTFGSSTALVVTVATLMFLVPQLN